jgi:biopolymer transport protein ExbB
MANVKKESGSNGGNMFSGIVIVLCILVGWIIWNLSWVRFKF